MVQCAIVQCYNARMVQWATRTMIMIHCKNGTMGISYNDALVQGCIGTQIADGDATMATGVWLKTSDRKHLPLENRNRAPSKMKPGLGAWNGNHVSAPRGRIEHRADERAGMRTN